MSIEESNKATQEHITKVQQRIIELLMQRASVHDASKLEEPEASGYAQLTARLENIVYGTDEYRQALVAAKDIIQHHYSVNTHHPEHYAKGVDDMSLLDIMEMLCDWKAASERTKQGSILNSIEYNAMRFNLSPQLTQVLRNTVIELGW